MRVLKSSIVEREPLSERSIKKQRSILYYLDNIRGIIDCKIFLDLYWRLIDTNRLLYRSPFFILSQLVYKRNRIKLEVFSMINSVDGLRRVKPDYIFVLSDVIPEDIEPLREY